MDKVTKPLVGIVMGSDSDWPLIKPATAVLKEFGIPFEVHVMSAHRTPDLACDYAASAQPRGLKIIIAAAGGAAHLGGVLAGHTILPVIGIPVKGGALNGMDSLLATLQMPAGIPVATVTLGSAGPINAALLAAQMLALSSDELTKKFQDYKEKLRNKVIDGNERVRKDIENDS